jgi:hypothetical protein
MQLFKSHYHIYWADRTGQPITHTQNPNNPNPQRPSTPAPSQPKTNQIESTTRFRLNRLFVVTRNGPIPAPAAAQAAAGALLPALTFSNLTPFSVNIFEGDNTAEDRARSNGKNAASAPDPAHLSTAGVAGTSRAAKGTTWDTLFATAQPPHFEKDRPGGKLVNGLRASERDADGNAIVHPERLILGYMDNSPQAITRLKAIAEDLRISASLGKESVYKWLVSEPVELMIGKSKINGEKVGHPTLVADRPDLKGRIGGELKCRKLDQNRFLLYVNKESGRYSDYPDRDDTQLVNVVKWFQRCGLNVVIINEAEAKADKGKSAVASTSAT